MKVSVVLLTFNQPKKLEAYLEQNFITAGYEMDELIWVDNGSLEIWEIAELVGELSNRYFKKTKNIIHSENLGVSKGFNIGYAAATGDIIVKMEDSLKPQNWLKTQVEHFEAIPNTACNMIHSETYKVAPERRRGSLININGKDVWPFMPMGIKAFKRSILKKVGYLREDRFQLSNHEDCEWAFRCERISQANGWINYMIPNTPCEDLDLDRLETPEYRQFKFRNRDDPRNHQAMAECAAEGFPYYSPF